jgi:hypothetical protein
VKPAVEVKPVKPAKAKKGEGDEPVKADDSAPVDASTEAAATE